MKQFHLLTLLLLFLSTGLYGQITVTGTVLDEETKEALVGATVQVVGTTNGAVTDVFGAFSITLNEPGALEVSYTGYTPKRIDDVKESGTIEVLLSTGRLLDEVVVVGYSTQKKANVTGSISVVDVDQVAKGAYSNVIQSMQGKVSGVTITQDGQPGGGRTNLKIRGITSVNGNTPLYVVDGVPTTSDLNNISATDIESIQILKDASASIYGSRAAAGVVIITTKKGKKGKLSVDAGMLSGVQQINRKIDLLDATQWGQVYWEASRNTGITPNHPAYGSGPEAVLNTNPYIIPNGKQIYQIDATGTNWYDEIYSDAWQQQYYLNITQGGEKGNFFLGLNYFDQDGLINHTNYNRINTRLNSSYKVFRGLTVGENLSVSFANEVQVGVQRGQDGVPTDVLRQHPALPVFDLKGGYAGKIGGFPDVRNNVSLLEKNKDNTNRINRVLGNIYTELDLFESIGILDGHQLKLRSSYGLEHTDNYARAFQASFQEGDFDIQNNFLGNIYNRGRTITWTNTISYDNTFGKHGFGLNLGYETVDVESEFLIAENTGFLIEDVDFTFQSAASGDARTSGGGTGNALRSFFGRLSYNFDERYLLSGIMRRDQTSRFSDIGYFPSVSAGWVISKESFFDGIGFASNIDQLKLRGSWGKLGNQTAGDFTQLSLFGSNINSGDYDIAGTNTGVEQGFVVLSRGNPNVTWETTTQSNIGLNLSMFNGKIDFEFDVWNKKTEDILFRLPLLAVQGEGEPPFVNIGEMSNKGIDANIAYNTKIGSDITLEVSAQFGAYRNNFDKFGFEVSLGNEDESYIETGDGITRIVERQPYGVFYGYQVEGIFQNQGEVDAHATQTGKDVGRLKYADSNGDGVVDDKDRVYLGSFHPDWTGGLGINLSWKNITFSTALYASVGNEVYNRNKIYTDFAQSELFNHGTVILDAWTPENTGSSIPAVILDDKGNNEFRSSSYFIENGSYLKVRHLKLGYQMPQQWLKGAGANIYVEVQNPFILTGYSGVDPELPFEGNSNIPGIDNGAYPLARTILLGVNINL